MLITANGLVIRSYPSGEHDRLIHLLTGEYGRLSVLIKGANSPRNREAAACTQLFTYGNYELYRGKGGNVFWFRGGSVLSAFYNLSSDLPRMALSAYLCDVASEITDEASGEAAGEENGQILRMLLNSLYVLEQGSKPSSLVKGVFEWRTAAMIGFMPRLTGCSVCGEGYPDTAYLDVMNGCLVCGRCQAERNRLAGRETDRIAEENGERRILCPLSAPALAAVRYALTAPDRRIFSYNLPEETDRHLFGRAAESYLLNHLERGFETLNFYRSVSGNAD